MSVRSEILRWRFMNRFSNNGFPSDFTWGAATAAFQIEGATTLDGRGESIWDRFAAGPGNVLNGDTGDPACRPHHPPGGAPPPLPPPRRPGLPVSPSPPRPHAPRRARAHAAAST